MATPEGKVKEQISKLLKKYACYYEMPVPGGYGKSGLDYTGCSKSRFFSVEAKAGKKLPTPRQELTMQAMQAAGGKTFLVNEEYGLEELEAWLNE